METSFQNAAGLFWPAGAMAETGRETAAPQPGNPLDSILQVLSEIAGIPSGTEVKRLDEKKPDALFNSNGAPTLASPDTPSTPPLVEPTPLNINVGAAISESNKLTTESNNAQMNPDSTRAVEQMKFTVDKVIEAKLSSVEKFEKSSAELSEKAGRWYNRLASWVSENLGPYMPYIGVAIAVIATAVTAGGAWPMLAMAGLGMANHILQKNDINVVEGVTKAVETVGYLVSEKVATALANTIGSVVGILLSDPTPISKLFGIIAKAAGASKATIEKAEQWGQIIGMVVIVGANLALTWGAGAANAVTKAASGATSAVGSAASRAANVVADAVKNFLRSLEPYVSKLLQIMRDSSGRFNELSVLFKDAMQAAKGTAAGAAMSLKDTTAALIPKLEVGVKVAQTAANGTSGTMGVTNGFQEVQLAGAQRDIGMAEAERGKLEQLVDVAREHMDAMDDSTGRAMNRVTQNLKASADMVRNYSRDGMERASIQVEQMTA
ncbi:hypothetical protein AKI39_19355 [Bordetella sp. H567]|uniref:YopB/SseC family type III secretion system translocon subunit n=1 Tax=Bordetella sp. H567 TaxID=1697043 RepID=UPI00081C4449|nr:YopB/SseC family type III secretion system translocon subunit [Bordetella sp. H567]AOB32416.1 hypothetical protein AKI39_19355 [Bordetella sp. H567]